MRRALFLLLLVAGCLPVEPITVYGRYRLVRIDVASHPARDTLSGSPFSPLGIVVDGSIELRDNGRVVLTVVDSFPGKPRRTQTPDNLVFGYYRSNEVEIFIGSTPVIARRTDEILDLFPLEPQRWPPARPTYTFVRLP